MSPCSQYYNIVILIVNLIFFRYNVFMYDYRIGENMKQYLYEYINEVSDKLNNKEDVKKLKEEILIKINFFQHERLVHLIVTLSFAILFFLSVYMLKYHFAFIFVNVILLICLIFYIIHYYYLENGVQCLYKLYDKMNRK